jgi:hypothetical protein
MCTLKDAQIVPKGVKETVILRCLTFQSLQLVYEGVSKSFRTES